MSSAESISFSDIKIIDGVCLGVSVAVTALRLFLRVRSGRIWWDDAWVLFSALSNIVMGTATFMHYGPPFAYSLATRLAAYYLIAEGFYLTLWAARLSILFSIIRIVPDKSQLRFLKWVAGAFMFVLVFLVAQVFWVCEAPGKRAWQKLPNPQCSLGLQVAVCQLVTDILADLLLIVVPTRLLLQTRSLPGPLKARLLIIFSATVLTTVVGLVHAAYLLEVRGVDAIISALVEVSVCLIVCNGVVLVPALYRAIGFRGAGDVVDSSGNMPGERSYRISSFRFRPVSGWTSRIGTRTGWTGASRTVGGVSGLTTTRWTTVLTSMNEGAILTTQAGAPGVNTITGSDTADIGTGSGFQAPTRVVEFQVPLPSHSLHSGEGAEVIELPALENEKRKSGTASLSGTREVHGDDDSDDHHGSAEERKKESHEKNQ